MRGNRVSYGRTRGQKGEAAIETASGTGCDEPGDRLVQRRVMQRQGSENASLGRQAQGALVN